MLEVSFIGRRSVFNELSNIVMNSISVRYVDSGVIRAVGNEICILDYYVDADCSGNCVRVGRHVESVELMGILTNIIVNILNHDFIKIGIDYGTERIGVILVYDNTPLIGSILTPVRLTKLIKLINSRLSGVAIGDSPASRRFLKRHINELCSIADNVLIIDELESSRLRNWVSTSGLMDDIADAYVIALTKPKVTIKCPNSKIT